MRVQGHRSPHVHVATNALSLLRIEHEAAPSGVAQILALPPLTAQKQIMDRVSAGREEIAREREAAGRLTREINAEVEALILGTKKASEL